MRHIVNMEDLEDFSFEHLICAHSFGGSSKSLVAYCLPYMEYFHYKLYVNKEVEGIYHKFEDALSAYNEV